LGHRGGPRPAIHTTLLLPPVPATDHYEADLRFNRSMLQPLDCKFAGKCVPLHTTAKGLAGQRRA
jgi:hypothetical protein